MPFNCEKLNGNSTCFNDHPWLVDDPTRGIGRWPRSVLDNSIFVHSSALSVMGVGKGDLVLVQNPDNGRKSVLRAWPAISVQGIPTDLATASHRVGACLQASSEETGFCQVSVAKFDITPLPAKSVRLKYSFSGVLRNKIVKFYFIDFQRLIFWLIVISFVDIIF